MFVAGDRHVDVGIENRFLIVLGFGQGAARWRADFAFSDEMKIAFRSDSIGGDQVDVVFERPRVHYAIGRAFRTGGQFVGSANRSAPSNDITRPASGNEPS